MLDLHQIASSVKNENAPGAFLESQSSAALQVVIIFLGSITRFLFNMLRPRDGEGLNPPKNPPIMQKGFSVFLGAFFATGSLVTWIFTTKNLMDAVGYPWDSTGYAREDAIVVWFVSLVQVGYPIVFFLEMAWLLGRSLSCGAFGAVDLRDVAHNSNPNNAKSQKPLRMMPGNQMDPGLSLFKDVAYGFLDTTTKGGLALYCAVRAAR